MRGTLVLVVGPSGAGKDSLIAAARAKLDGGAFVFPRRHITRPPDSHEDHVPETPDAFDTLEADGAFALCWRAHGLGYGVPIAIERALTSGRHVVVNVSRTIVDDARERHAPVCVIEVTAPPQTLATRLESRGRESGAAIASRVERQQTVQPDFVVVNDGALEIAVTKFLSVLSTVENSRRAP